MSNKSNPTVATMGIDIGKNSFHVVGLDQRGAIVLRQKWSRRQIEVRLANIPPCLIGMEACVGAHHLSRNLQSHGHDAQLMPAKYVRPYSKGQKNDFRDAEAIAEAVQRPTMKFVATKTADQLDLHALHRVRERLVHGAEAEVNAGLVELIKDAFTIRIQLLSGSDDSIEAMSGRLGMNKCRLTSLIRLSYLAPDIVRALLEGRQPISKAKHSYLQRLGRRESNDGRKRHRSGDNHSPVECPFPPLMASPNAGNSS